MNSSWSRFSFRRATALLILLVGLVLITTAMVRADPAAPEIVGGQEADPGEWPWQVALVFKESDIYFGQFCGGSIIARTWVVTAAHCVYEENSSGQQVLLEPSRLDIVAGIHDLAIPDTGFQRVSVAQIIPHPDYDYQTHDNDIALIELASPVDARAPSATGLPIAFGNLAPGSIGDLTGVLSTVTGWGNRDPAGSDYPDRLHEVEVPIISNAECANSYNLTDNMLCAGLPQGGKDSCQGDSGGPLVIYDSSAQKWVQVGVVSFGVGCAEPGFPGVYARVSRYANWINSYVKPFEATNFAYAPVVLRVPLAPSLPTLVAPSNGSSLNTLIPTFRWTMPPAVDGELRDSCLSFGTDPNPVGCDYSGGYREEDTLQIWSNLDPATRYYWRIGIVKDGNYNDISWSDTWQFTTGSNGVILPAPALISPPDASTISMQEAFFEWSSVPGSVEYQLLTCADGQGCYIWFTTDEWIDFSTEPYTPALGDSRWYVAARNDYGWGMDSEQWTYYLEDSLAAQTIRPLSAGQGWSSIMPDGTSRFFLGK